MGEMIINHSYLVLVWPLCTFLLIGLWLGRTKPVIAGRFAIIMAGLTMLNGFAIATAYVYRVLLDPAQFPDRTMIAAQFDWLNFTPDLTAKMGILLDPISVMMLTVVVVIAFLVTCYSVGYMRGDHGFGRFFALLALFVFSMLGLVLSTNLLQIFVFWELVGVSSYSLIGFWYYKPSAVAASKKAFIMTRVADAFFLLGIIMVSFYCTSFDFAELNSPAAIVLLNKNVMIAGFSINVLSLGTMLIFAGGWGKSAMFPLHVWLPDAMEGPTPVSSIIHSATMVVAGVYLTARMFPLFAAAPGTLQLIGIVGSFTALFAAIIACTQVDIKRILAFSTLSQLGYMMLALGTAKINGVSSGLGVNPAGFSAAMFHVFTHAFFKCLLFLGAGIIIHAVHSNDINKMGGLRKVMPKIYWSVMAACLAIAGIFPLAGFWSKDEILISAWQSGHHVITFVGLLTGGLTAFYMFRFFFLIFHGRPRTEYGHIDEDPLMTYPVVILAVPSIVAGFFWHYYFAEFMLPPLSAFANQSVPGHGPHWLPFVASAAALGGIGIAWLMYNREEAELANRLQGYFPIVHRLVLNKFYIDELYLYITHTIIFKLIAEPVKWLDRHVVDATIDLVGGVFQLGGRGVRLAHNGRLTIYLGVFVLGIVLLRVMS